MKSVFISAIFSVFLLPLFAQENIIKSPAGANINFFVRNVCQDFDQIIICDGDSANNIHPSLGIIDCSTYSYKHIDSLLLFTNIKYFDLDPVGAWQWSSKLLCLGNENLLITYEISYPQGWCDSIIISPLDTIQTDSIADVNVYYDWLIYIRETGSGNNFFHSSFSLSLNFIPVAISTYGQQSAVVGINQNNETELAIIDLLNHSIIKDTILAPQMENIHSVHFINNEIQIAYCPGDTVVNILHYNYFNNTYLIQNAYSGSGIHAAHWLYDYFYFQPESDPGLNGLENQMLVYDFNSPVAFFNINKRLKSIQSNSYMNIIGVEDIPSNDKIYFYTSNGLILFDSLNTCHNPYFYTGDFRCPVKVDEYDDSKVEWKVYPNPSKSDFNLIASGLICGRDYKVDIIDMTGAIKYENTIHAKMVIELPTANYPGGIYFIRIHTLKGMIVQKVVKF